ncbi:NACHT domain-containing protein [Flagellimonas sp.]|uniref:NACHT domain-containing protein n=1 Tax=Flagellimonas sp. TaxID=2058762 RepID=UPI003BAFBCC7
MAKKRNNGKFFEEQAKFFFSRIFGRLGYPLLKDRPQFSGTQDGFDIQFMVSDGMSVRNIFVECKDYATDVAFGNIYAKLHDLESSGYLLRENDIAIFISPRSNFGNHRNPEKAELTFNRNKYPFKICLFERSHGIDRLFALEPEIYKAVYRKKLSFEIDEEKELDRFRTLLFYKISSEEKIVPGGRRARFITHLAREEHYIQRGVTLVQDPETDDRQLFNILNKEAAQFGIKDVLRNVLTDSVCPGVVLLGNPGMGKSIELKELAIDFWEGHKEFQWVPFYRSVNSIGKQDTLEDHLPPDWKEISQLLIILDGLDEISYGQSFRTMIENFIQNHDGGTVVKFVISCRTNMYESTIRDITNFRCCTLNSLHFKHALHYLVAKYQMPRESNYYGEIAQDQKEFFENPYYLNLLGDYYKEGQKLPDNKSELMERYTSKRLRDDEMATGKTQDFDSGQILQACKKVALSLEAMQMRRISGEQLTSLLQENKNVFINSGFVQRVVNQDQWEFEHRNLQEFFVAKTLYNFSAEKIIEFISLDDDKPKTHPSWLNSISYLINLLDTTSEKIKKLVKWLLNNDATVLFKADRSRISDSIRKEVFQGYFNKRCKEQTLWFKKYDQETREIVRFADSTVNREFLMQELKDDKNHRRTRISAMSLLSQMDTVLIEEEFKGVLLGRLQDPLTNVDMHFKAEILHTIYEKGFHISADYGAQVVAAVSYIDHERITSALLQLIVEMDTDDYIDYLKSIATMVGGTKQREHQTRDNYATGEKRYFIMALLNLRKPKNQVYALQVFLEHKDALRWEQKDLTNLIDSMAQNYTTENKLYEYIMRWLISALENRQTTFRNEQNVVEFFKKTGTVDKAFMDLYESSLALDSKRYFLAHLVADGTLPVLVKDYQNATIEENELYVFRNVLSRVDVDLAQKFEKLVLRETEYRLKEDFIDVQLRKQWQEYHSSKEQSSFDLLFDGDRLKKLAGEYFALAGKAELEWDDMQDNRQEFWDDLDLQRKFLPSFQEIVHDTKREQDGPITLTDVKKNIDNDLYLLFKVKRELTHQSKKDIVERPEHMTYIKAWCLNNEKKGDFKNALKQFQSRNYLICELLWFFGRRYGVTYQESTYLDMLWIDYHLEEGGVGGYDYILEQVDAEKVKARIIENLREGLEEPVVFHNHAEFALTHGLKEVYPLIAEYLADNGLNRYRRLKLLESYTETTGDVRLLKEILGNEAPVEDDNSLYWDATVHLINLGQNDFVIGKTMEVLQKNKGGMEELTAIKHLVRAGHPMALKFFNEWLKEGNRYDRKEHRFFSTVDFSKFYAPGAINDILELIEMSISREIKGNDYFDPIRTVYEILKSFYAKANQNDFTVLLSGLEDCKHRLAKKPELDLYYIHDITNEAWDAYFKMRSKPISFPEIAERIDNLKYML